MKDAFFVITILFLSCAYFVQNQKIEDRDKSLKYYDQWVKQVQAREQDRSDILEFGHVFR